MARVTIPGIRRMKDEKRKIVMMTAYDFQMAAIIDRAGVEMVLVGDSGGRYLLGHEDNNSVTLDEMVLMTRSVSRAVKRAVVVGDMPFMTYQVSREEAVRNAGRLIQEGGAQAVKLEVGADYASTVKAVVKAGIPVMGHMGMTPMVNIGSGDYRSSESRVVEDQVWRDARALAGAGCFSLLFTGISPDLAKRITEEISIPTLAGFGAGDDCDGQIGVTHGVLGFTVEELDRPRSVYGPLAASFLEAARRFTDDVRAGKSVRSQRDRKERQGAS
jgi:3-methyl-2-oxobutanoate hydroxymethyltransferase